MKRYDMEIEDTNGWHPITPYVREYERPDGEWVRFTDHEAALASKDRANESLREGMAKLAAEVVDAKAEVGRLREVMISIAKDTDADNPDSYRADDREGCLDTIFAIASAALEPKQ